MRKFNFDIDDWTGGNTISKDMGDVVGSTVDIAFKLTTYPTMHFMCILIENYPNMKIDWGDGEVTYTETFRGNKSMNLEHIYDDNIDRERIITFSFLGNAIDTKQIDINSILYFDNTSTRLKQYDIISGYKNIFYNFICYSDAFFHANYEKICKVNISPNIKAIGVNALCDFISNDELIIPDSVKYIGDKGCTGIKINNKLSLPKNAQYGVESFSTIRKSNISAGIDLIVPENLTELNNEMFAYINLKGNLILPSKLKKIGSNCFTSSTFTGTLKLPNTLESIDNGAFSHTSFTNANGLVIPDSVTKIGYSAFLAFSVGGELVLSKNLEVIDEMAFESCYTITGKVVIPQSVKTIGDYAFADCLNIEEIHVPYHTVVHANTFPKQKKILKY